MPDFFQSMIPIIILLFGHWTGESKMEFDAHMRLHFDHRCPFCDYSSRTEGRLRCHIKTFHADGGLCSAAPTTDQAAKRKPKIITCQKCGFKAKEKVRIVEIWQSQLVLLSPEIKKSWCVWCLGTLIGNRTRSLSSKSCFLSNHWRCRVLTFVLQCAASWRMTLNNYDDNLAILVTFLSQCHIDCVSVWPKIYL